MFVESIVWAIILQIPFTEILKIACSKTFFKVWIVFFSFRTPFLENGIDKKFWKYVISSVPLSETRHLSHIMYALFCQLELSKLPLLQIRRCQNHVFSASNIISGRRSGVRQKILKRILDVPLSSIWWCKFWKFSLKISQMKKYGRNSKNLKLWAQKYPHCELI